MRKRDQGKALAGRNTLNRLELTPRRADANSRYKKIVADQGRIELLFVDIFLQLHRKPPERIVLDLDATDDPLHGDQLGKFFHGYCKSYCYLPLYIFCGDHLLSAKLRPADIDGAAGSVKELYRIVGQIREVWPEVQIVIRGDSGFCRENIMAWCEAKGVGYILGLAKNQRLQRILGKELLQVIRQFGLEGTKSARARCDTIRLKLLKIGASVRVTVRRIWLSMSESCRYQELFAVVYANLRIWLPQLVPR